LDAGATLDLKASATATLRGSMVHVGCASGGRPVARQNDQVVGSASPGGSVSGQIAQGSPTVLTC
jgi:uncharacterized Zn-binding protein involved in type VI secretion